MANSTYESLWQPELIKKYDLAGPRYTSYPTAAQFSPGNVFDDWLKAVEKSNEEKAPLSLYFHIPFCDTVCYYCACNKIITANKKIAAPYVDKLNKEIALQAQYVDSTRKVKQLHWGGGTPTYISHEEMQYIMQATAKHFSLYDNDEGEYSIEVHPAGISPNRITQLRQLGFNRLSMGIQDFDPAVQQAVNRFNSLAEVQRLMKAIRENEFHGVSMDLIYGLPHQNVQSFRQTLERVIELSPDRLSIFNYAHMPHLFKTQKQINFYDLPEPQEKLAILQMSIEKLLDAGYVYIGMDHFAKPDDELAIAQHKGKLRRNFQGYATHADCDLYAFGLTSISSIGNVLIQNHKQLDAYSEAIDQGNLAFFQGVTLTEDDLIRRDIINSLMCNFRISYSHIEQKYQLEFQSAFATELSLLQDMVEDGLLEVTNEGIEVLAAGRMLIRRICMIFDAYIPHQPSVQQKRYSRII